MRARDLRVARGLKQEDMCRFGFEYKYYQRIEYGQKTLSLKMLTRLAKAFGVPVADLFRFD
jgi:transcriptional regulator with XRE-family HTH domain